jgi:hypothetical protein
MKERFSELGYTVWASFLVVIVLAIITLGSLFVQRVAYPWWLSIQRESVENSKSFVDANNNMLETYKLEFSRLDTKIAEAKGDGKLIEAYEAQQKAILERMCKEISTMKIETVNPSTLTWLNSKGGCK